MNDGSIAPQQDVSQHEGKAMLPSAFARLNGKSAVHQEINFGAKHHEPPPGVLTDNEKVAFVRRSGRRISAGQH
jgi:hypothetical protein